MNSGGRINTTLLDLIRDELIAQFCLLDVGCGSGALTFALAPDSRYVIGIDISRDRIEEAQRYAIAKNIKNVSFHVKDAYTTDYRSLGSIDMVVSHLCMSDEIVSRSYQALQNGHPFAFACFHSENLKELGRRSRFSYTKSEIKKLLLETGFKIEYLEVEKEKIEFRSRKEALDYFNDRTKIRWQRDGRWSTFLSFLDEGGRSITKSRLVVKARKM
ncbi:MAG: class I SAM-dependent methyltransferase [Candidatus Hydrothermarchaeales archaeon]